MLLLCRGSLLLCLLFSIIHPLLAAVSTNPIDVAAMHDLLDSIKSAGDALGWSSKTDPCSPKLWKNVSCFDGRVTKIQIGNQNLTGTLPSSLANLTSLIHFEIYRNSISGPLPSLKGLSSLQRLNIHDNKFTSMPFDFFSGMTSLQFVSLDRNPFKAWKLPDSLKDATNLLNFSASDVNLKGGVPSIFAGDAFPSLGNLFLSSNPFTGPLPSGFAGSLLESLWLNGCDLSGSIDVIGNMTNLSQLWLQSNKFSGSLPDFSRLQNLVDLNLRDNMFTGPVPESLVKLKSLKSISLTNNMFQGPVPEFGKDINVVDVVPTKEKFCLPMPGPCDSRVNVLLSVAKSFGYPQRFAQNWVGNNPCNDWLGIRCDGNGNIIVLNFVKMGLSGVISPDFSLFLSLQGLLLSSNNITGTIPESLTSLSNLTQLDVSDNALYGKVPNFRNGVKVNTNGNPNIGQHMDPDSDGNNNSPGSHSTGDGGEKNSGKSSSVGVTVGYVFTGIFTFLLVGLLSFCIFKRKKNYFAKVQNPNTMVTHPPHSGSDQELLKTTISGSNMNASDGAVMNTLSPDRRGPSDVYVLEVANMVISIQVLRNVTNNFSHENILGRGGFGSVYKGELHDGTKIAVKRMESGAIGSQGTDEFKSEISVLTKVRHRHLVSLLGYCLDGNERLLVYEYMPQGTLSQHLFNLNEHCKPLEWKLRLSIALDVARGVEYLHTLANQSFIHRDLKPSNILLTDDMRAKVADFGLVRLVPDNKRSVQTRLAGTFGYLAPEYAATGRLTTKADVFSFGVILMELITGRKALDENRPEESVHLVTWFRRMQIKKDSFEKIIDSTINLDDETLVSINEIAELAGHCCAREPYQRPEMGYAVNVLSSLSEIWKPSDLDSLDDIYDIDLNMSLLHALEKWKNFESTIPSGSSSLSVIGSLENTQSSIPAKPTGFADSFTSTDGR